MTCWLVPSAKPIAFLTRSYGGELRPSYGGLCRSNRTPAVDFRTNVKMTTLLWSVSAVMYPVICSVTASGSFLPPAALGLLLRIARPFGVSVPPKTSSETTARERRANFFRAPPRKPGPLAKLRQV
jgi:hypothetical protein